MQIESRISSLLEYYAEMQLILCKDMKKDLESKRNENFSLSHLLIIYI